MENEVRERLVQFMHREKLTGVTLSKVLGMNRGTLQSKLNGSRILDVDTLCQIMGAYGDLSVEWLMMGKGQMYNRETPNGVIVTGDHNTTANVGLGDQSKDKEIEMLKAQLEEEKNRSNQYWELITKLTQK